jgi:hypothetical protein
MWAKKNHFTAYKLLAAIIAEKRTLLQAQQAKVPYVSCFAIAFRGVPLQPTAEILH